MKIIPITEHPERDRAAVLCSLKELHKGELLAVTKELEDTYWILKKPFNAFPQTVSLSPESCLAISEIINNFCEKMNDTSNMCDPSKIVDEDIKNLIYIMRLLVDGEKELDSNGELD